MDRVQIEIQIYKSTISLCFVCECVSERDDVYVWDLGHPHPPRVPKTWSHTSWQIVSTSAGEGGRPKMKCPKVDNHRESEAMKKS